MFDHGIDGRLQERRERLRRSIVDILEARGFVLSADQRACIAACEAVETLERWYATAKTAATDQSVDQWLN